MRNSKLALLTSIILLLSINLFATAQYPDKIFYKGKEYSLQTNPMESYFKKYPDKKPRTEIISSALWRGYVATFEFSDNLLILKDINIRIAKKTNDLSSEIGWKSVISEVSPKNENLKIDWFTGILVLPYGEIVNYVHLGYGSTYEFYILLEVEKGVLKKSKEFDYNKYVEFKQKQFEAFKKTQEYKKLVEDLRKENRDENLIESFLKDFVINYSSKILVD